MFDIGAAELLVIVVVAILVIGPNEMPRALRSAGRWVGKLRRMSNHFRSGIDAMIREAELEDAEKEWKQRNAKIMAETPGDPGEPAMEPLHGAPHAEAAKQPDDPDSRAEAAIARAAPHKAPEHGGPPPELSDSPELPLDPATPPRDEG